MPETHASHIGGSSFKRLYECPGSFLAAAGIVAPVHDAATRGTALHTCAEMIADDPGFDPQTLLGAKIEDYEITQADIDDALSCVVEAMARLRAEGAFEFEIEPNVASTDPRLDGCSGWIDLLVRHPAMKTVTVLDWKFGRQDVSPVENLQGQFYAAMAAIDEHVSDLFEGMKHVRIVIVQPNTDADVWQEWTFPIEELHNVRATIAATRQIMTQPNAPMKKGSWCHFCPKKPTCNKWTEIAMALPYDKEVADL